MIERGQGAHALKFLDADLNRGDAGTIVEMWDDVSGHGRQASLTSSAGTIARAFPKARKKPIRVRRGKLAVPNGPDTS